MWPISLDRISAWFRPAQPIREQIDRFTTRLSNTAADVANFQNSLGPARTLGLITGGMVVGAPATAAGAFAYFAYPHVRPTFENTREALRPGVRHMGSCTIREAAEMDSILGGGGLNPFSLWGSFFFCSSMEGVRSLAGVLGLQHFFNR